VALSSTTAVVTGAGTTAAGASTTASGSASPSASGKSAAPKVGAGLKVYIGVALVGALAVLSL
jgi:hypothetical protein